MHLEGAERAQLVGETAQQCLSGLNSSIETNLSVHATYYGLLVELRAAQVLFVGY